MSWRRWVAVVSLLAASGCGNGDGRARDGADAGSPGRYAGLLQSPGMVHSYAVVDADKISGLPESAPAYSVRPGDESTLRALAERYAGGPVQPGHRGELVDGSSFGVPGGDVYAHFNEDGGGGSAQGYDLRWQFFSSAAHTGLPADSKPCAVPPTTEQVATAQSFLQRFGLDVEFVDLRADCYPSRGIPFQLKVDGRRMHRAPEAMVSLGARGEVRYAEAPLLTFAPVDDVALAPAAVVRQRLESGMGVYSGCVEDCEATVAEPVVDLLLAPISGDPVSWVLLPAVRLSISYSQTQGAPGAVLAVSTASLVNQGGTAAARLDEQAAPVGEGRCAQPSEPAPHGPALCVSAMDVRAGTPVAIAAFAGRLHVRGGATCRPALVVRVGSGEERVAGGAEAAWREVYVMSEPGSYEVTATRTSRCPSNYDYIGGGDPPYEDSVSIEVTVRA